LGEGVIIGEDEHEHKGYQGRILADNGRRRVQSGEDVIGEVVALASWRQIVRQISEALTKSQMRASTSIEIEYNLHSIKAEPSINSTSRGMSIDRSDKNENALDSIRGNREFDLNEIEESDLRFEKHDDPDISTFRGISIDRNDDSENAFDSIRVNREFNSNEIDERDLQQEKHDDPTISTFRGMSIDRGDENENAFDSIRVSREFDSNEIVESELQQEKHDDPRISTFREFQSIEAMKMICFRFNSSQS
jgi:hypothetical protein